MSMWVVVTPSKSRLTAAGDALRKAAVVLIHGVSELFSVACASLGSGTRAEQTHQAAPAERAAGRKLSSESEGAAQYHAAVRRELDALEQEVLQISEALLLAKHRSG